MVEKNKKKNNNCYFTLFTGMGLVLGIIYGDLLIGLCLGLTIGLVLDKKNNVKKWSCRISG